MQVIIIPGTTGSKLEENNETVWPKLFVNKEIHNFYHKLKDLNNVNIQATKIIHQTYGKIVNTLKKKYGEQVETFYYDWRQNNLCHVKKLQSMICERNADEVIIVAHSMGGIIAKLFLNTCADKLVRNKVKKLITLGTPWLGSAEAYNALKFGKETPYVISSEKSKEINCYFPSVYQLLPRREYITKLLKENIGFYVKENVPQSWENTYNYYCELLKSNGHGKKVLDEYYNALRSPLSIEHHEIIGYNKPTFLSIIENLGEETQGYIASGDGTVTLLSAVSRAASKQYFIECEHEGLVKREEVLQLLISIIDNNITDEIYSEKILTYKQVENISFEMAIKKYC